MEQDPEEWRDAFCQAARDVIGEGDASPAAVALSGQMQNVVLVKGGHSLRPCLLYSDVRAVSEAEEIRVQLTENCDSVGSKLSNFKGAAACLCKLLWLAKNDATTLDKAEHVLLGAHSFLAYVLCGSDRDSVACDVTTASTTGLLGPDIYQQETTWAHDAIDEIDGINSSLLPPLIEGVAPGPVGKISSNTIHKLNLPKSLTNVPVFHGIGDLASTTIGAVGVGNGQNENGDKKTQNKTSSSSYLYLGTSGWVARCVDVDSLADSSAGSAQEKQAPTTFTLLHPDPSLRIVAASMVTAGGNVEWARRLLLDATKNSAKDFDALASQALPGSDGVLYLPHLNGERSPFTDPTARGCFVNLSPKTNKNTLTRATLEGVAYNYRTLFDALDVEKNKNTPVPFLGGGANSKVWTQIIADCTKCSISPISDASLIAARGCAAGAFVFLKLWGSQNKAPRGYFPNHDVSDGRAENIYHPDASAAAVHDKQYLVWARLHKALADAGAGEIV